MCVWKILEASVTLADEAGFVEVLPNVVPHLLGGGTVIIYDQFVIIVINGNLFVLYTWKWLVKNRQGCCWHLYSISCAL